MNKGLIFDIRRFSVHDGPGIRTTVFFKGCPLSCWWCHNPESRSTASETCQRSTRLDGHEFVEDETIGKRMSSDEIMEVIRKDEVFYRSSGGGVTFSGGEPLLQAGFLKEVLAKCKSENFHTTVDTSGYATRADFKSILPYTDLFLYDLKPMNPREHLYYTGVSNRVILENLDFLFLNGKQIIIRMPLIPGITDTAENVKSVISFLTHLKKEIKEIDLLPYHSLGKNKYRKLSVPDRMDGLAINYENDFSEIKKMLEQENFRVKTGG